jgi:hypothetical protein
MFHSISKEWFFFSSFFQAEIENALLHVEEADFSAMMTAADFDVLLALSHDIEVENLEQNFSHLNPKWC